MRRQGGSALAAPAIQFKGSGWYVTDYGGKKEMIRKVRVMEHLKSDDKSAESKASSEKAPKKAPRKTPIGV
jgi:predicted nucleic acid-binding Zn ribbon protein